MRASASRFPALHAGKHQVNLQGRDSWRKQMGCDPSDCAPDISLFDCCARISRSIVHFSISVPKATNHQNRNAVNSLYFSLFGGKTAPERGCGRKVGTGPEMLPGSSNIASAIGSYLEKGSA